MRGTKGKCGKITRALPPRRLLSSASNSTLIVPCLFFTFSIVLFFHLVFFSTFYLYGSGSKFEQSKLSIERFTGYGIEKGKERDLGAAGNNMLDPRVEIREIGRECNSIQHLYQKKSVYAI